MTFESGLAPRGERATVIDDGVKDELVGGAGADWFWGKNDSTDIGVLNNVREVVS